jgi:hypothetical protein
MGIHLSSALVVEKKLSLNLGDSMKHIDILDDLKASGVIKDYKYTEVGDDGSGFYEELAITFKNNKTLYISPFSGSANRLLIS